ncbi:uncharacterized protein TRAVEDRAFT_68716 [Trametes versicolor FP-101664 SS1]|uniref:uncharacterized protein n=1 Tax=Trametes versicolor (strain FP-101664) TaxID=717944 RepID=UPI00046235DD|nr:uncharacterized protein TRAVEDRAFT_68716 [Trametes versicolor FP-101664 SS1]EIW65109.1 hypothetical protein TRAVEDRAFT_68716 [Trametes versicolor FP-101664 SS1]
MSSTVPLSPSFESLVAAPHNTDEPPPLEPPLSPKVRFDQDCVLIPDPLPASRLPRLVTKSYSLPLWKRKQREPSLVSDTEDDSSEDHVVFKVSVPSLTTKARSPSRGDAAHRPLVPCLVHSAHLSDSSVSSIDPTTPCQSPQRQNRPRRASLPQPVQPDAVTVPLRSCCAQCYASIDSCMKLGEHWQVHFSKGAARRRKSVSDTHAPKPSRSARHCVRDAMPGFDAIIAVDEVDRRRRSTDIDALTAFSLELPACAPAPTGPDDLQLRRALSLPDEVHPCRSGILHHLAHAAPIPEEDEPRRTPIPSPFASTTNLPATRIIHAVQAAKLVERTISPPPEVIAIRPIAVPVSSLPEKAALRTPLPASPSPPPLAKEPMNYFSVPYQPGDRYAADSPSSSPSSSPQIEHTVPAGLGSPRKRSRLPAPASIFRASTQMLKGMTGMSGMPMSV